MQGKKVASFTDAWIETGVSVKIGEDVQSRIFYRCVDWNNSLTVQEVQESPGRIFYRCVDWNNFLTFPPAILNVASFTDAWIETAPLFITLTYNPVASFTDAWIETFTHEERKDLAKVASFTDAWIETILTP